MKLTGKLLKQMIIKEMMDHGEMAQRYYPEEDTQRSFGMVQFPNGMVQEVSMEEFRHYKAKPDYIDVTDKLPEAGNMLIHVSNIPIPRGSGGDMVNEEEMTEASNPLEKQFDKLGREPTPPMAGTGFERRMPSMVGKYNTNAGFLSYVLPGGEVKNIKLSYEEMQGFKKALEQMGYTRNDSMPVANTHGFDLQRNR